MQSFSSVKIVGAGRAAPELSISTARIADILGIKPPDWYARMTGMEKRRFLYDIDPVAGEPIITLGTPDLMDLVEHAVRDALNMAGLVASDLDGIYHVTCTPDELHFSQPAIAVHERLGLRPDAFAEHLNSGCGGGLVAMLAAAERIASQTRRYIAVVASNCTSRYFSRAVYTMVDPEHGHPIPSHLTFALFGDGAACVIVGPSSGSVSDGSIRTSFSHVGHAKLVRLPAGGATLPAYRALPWQHTYFVDGVKVKDDYVAFMGGLLAKLRAGVGPSFDLDCIARFYIHPASVRMIEAALQATDLGSIQDRLPALEHAKEYGNMSAAGVLFQFAEDLASGVVSLGSGQEVVLGAIGAGVHAAGCALRL